MSRRLHRLWLLPALLLASQSWALGLGDIRLDSALNEPLRAEIDLLSATDEELKNLTIQLASVDTFDRYDLDRPLFLTGLQFQIVRTGDTGGIVRVTSAEPITEPFVTFLVEAAWSRGRLLREYTVLLDPPTFAPPPAVQAPQAVTAPTQAPQNDRGQIQRPAPQPAAQPAPRAPPRQTAPQPATPDPEPVPAAAEPQPAAPVADEVAPAATAPAYDTATGGDMLIQRGDTLWAIAQRTRPDDRLTVQQTMLAIYETNPQAFAGNINRMSAGATLRIPSADDVFRISRNEALAEVQRQNDAWSGGSAGLPAPQPQQSLTLVPPDDDVDVFDDAAVEPTADLDNVTVDLGDPDAERIREIEAQLIDHQNSVIEITDNELAVLRAELAALRGEELPQPPVDAMPVADDPLADTDDSVAEAPVEAPSPDDTVAVDDSTPVEEDPDIVEPAPAPVVAAPAPAESGIVDTLLGYLGNFWVWIGAAILAALGLLFWFARRSGQSDDEDATGMWQALDEDDADSQTMASTERLSAMARDDDTAIVVVEEESETAAGGMDTIEVPAAGLAAADPESEDEFVSTAALDKSAAASLDAIAATGDTPDNATASSEALEFTESAEDPAPTPAAADAPASIEDTFSSETAINLDQSDPIAEADFHMAYGLYDQAADLINGALENDGDSPELLAKLCEIYFVWGNRDAFVDAAGRMASLPGGKPEAEWDKIVIMGQQIASDHELFSGASAAGAGTREIDLEFDSAPDDTGALDLDLAGSGTNEIIDIGDDTSMVPEIDPTAEVEFDIGAGLDLDDVAKTQEIAQAEEMSAAETIEMAAAVEDTVESPTIEQPSAGIEVTAEMPAGAPLGPNDATELASLDDLDDPAASEATAEIDLDDLDLDLVGLNDDPLAGDDDAEDSVADIDATGESPAFDLELAETGKNPALEETGKNPAVQDETAETGKNPAVPDALAATDADIEFDARLLDATGQTSVLDPGSFVDESGNAGIELSDEDQTLLADPLGDDSDIMLGEDDKTLLADSLPAGDDAKTVIASLDDDDDDSTTLADDTLSLQATGEMPGIPGSTDMDLDLDDLTAALQVSEVGDTAARKQMADDAATVEQPLIRPAEEEADTASTGLHDARTMTEVGTKLDLARAYVDMGDPSGARSILEEVLDEGDEGQRQQAQQLLETLPS